MANFFTSRDHSLAGQVFANSAETALPITPVPGTSYRDPAILRSIIENGWPFSTAVNSADFNQIMYLITGLLGEIEGQGILNWSDKINYKVGAVVRGSDGMFYVAKEDSGPGVAGVNRPIDPISDDVNPNTDPKARPNSSVVMPSQRGNYWYMLIGKTGEIRQWDPNKAAGDDYTSMYVWFWNGLLLEAGVQSIKAGKATFNVVYPKAFSSNINWPIVCDAGTSDAVSVLKVTGRTATGFTVKRESVISTNDTFRWFSIGFRQEDYNAPIQEED